jgi:predicted MFS family arabinose efflux permease
VGIFLSWSLTGIILALLPGHVGRWSGMVTFAAIVPGVLIQLLPDRQAPVRMVRIGCVLLAAALVAMIVALHARSTALLFASFALSAFSGFGFTYAGGLTATLVAARDAPARAAAGYYLLGYLGLGLPCVGVGYLANRWGLERALLAYALTIGACASLWFVVNALRAREGRPTFIESETGGST